MIGKRNVSVCSGHELANALYTMCYNERMKGFTGEGATLLDWNEYIGEIKTVPMFKGLLI